MALINCKECGQEMSKKAEKCPNCGAPGKKRTSGFTWFMTVIVVLVMFVMLAPDDNSNPATNGNSYYPIKIGEPFKTDKFIITVSKIATRNSVGSGFFAVNSSEGGMFVTVEWNYKNISKRPISSFNTPTMSLISPDGAEYTADIDATSSFATELNLDSKILSDLNPGIKVRNAKVFEVSKTNFVPKEWVLRIHADSDAELNL